MPYKAITASNNADAHLESHGFPLLQANVLWTRFYEIRKLHHSRAEQSRAASILLRAHDSGELPTSFVNLINARRFVCANGRTTAGSCSCADGRACKRQDEAVTGRSSEVHWGRGGGCGGCMRYLQNWCWKSLARKTPSRGGTAADRVL
jgi:hypothetical protein